MSNRNKFIIFILIIAVLVGIVVLENFGLKTAISNKLSQASQDIKPGEELVFKGMVNLGKGLTLNQYSDVDNNQLYLPELEDKKLTINVYSLLENKLKNKINYNYTPQFSNLPVSKVAGNKIFIVDHKKERLVVLDQSGKLKQKIKITSRRNETDPSFREAKLVVKDDYFYIFNPFLNDNALQKYDFEGNLLEEYKIADLAQLLEYKDHIYGARNGKLLVFNDKLNLVAAIDDFTANPQYIFYKDMLVAMDNKNMTVTDFVDKSIISLENPFLSNIEDLIEDRIEKENMKLISNEGRLFLLNKKDNRLYELAINKTAEVSFADENLESLIRNKINKSSGKITKRDLKKIRNLTIDVESLSTLTDLRHFDNLKVLRLAEGYGIEDISPLAELEQLKELYLPANEIGDISPLFKLTELEVLDLSNNKIESIVPLTKIKKLTSLNLKNNNIQNITPLGGLKQLEELNLENNQVNEVNTLSQLTQLKQLNLAKNKISEVKPLTDLSELWKLDLSRNQIGDISSLQKLKNLEVLYLNHNQIEKVDKLANITKINSLYLENNSIKDISPLTKLENLKVLHINNNQVEEITPLLELPKLKEIGLRGNKLDLAEEAEDYKVIKELEAKGVKIGSGK